MERRELRKEAEQLFVHGRRTPDGNSRGKGLESNRI